MPFLLFYVTHPDEETAHRVSAHLIDRRLAACANIFPIASAYWWQGATVREGEWVSVIKTRLDLEKRVEEEIRAIHPYEVPCILRFEARANDDYEAWIAAETAARE